MDPANSSVKTHESPNIRLAPRPLNYFDHIHGERDHTIGTADRASSGLGSLTKSIESQTNAQFQLLKRESDEHESAA